MCFLQSTTHQQQNKFPADPIPFFVRSRALKNNNLFQEQMDEQIPQPSFFRDTPGGMWNKFVNKQIECVLSKPFPSVHFAVATGATYKMLSLL